MESARSTTTPGGWPPLRAVVFDLDGTLIDAFEDIRLALNHAYARLDFPPVSPERNLSLVGNGVARLIEDGAPRTMSDAEREQARADFTEYYEAHMIDHARPYPGVEEALRVARGRGLRLAALSNKPDALTRSIVERLGLAGHFELVRGLAPGRARKPDPRSLGDLLDALGVAGPEALMVGDGETDMTVGRAMGARVAACLYGARRREQLAPFDPDLWVGEPRQLTRWLEDVEVAAAKN